MYSINPEILLDQISKLIQIVHEASGRVFLVMTDNLRANVSCFKMFHDKYGSITEYSVKHQVENEEFKELHVFFDPIHLFKNIKNNWLTEKMKKLRFYVPGCSENIVADWNNIVNVYKDEKNHSSIMLLYIQRILISKKFNSWSTSLTRRQ